MRTALAIAALVLAAASVPGFTSQTPAPQAPGALLVLSVIDVKPDMMAEFGELQAQTMAAQRKGGQAWRETWNVLQFGNPHRVGVLRPLAGFAELDGQTHTIKGAEGNDLLDRLAGDERLRLTRSELDALPITWAIRGFRDDKVPQ